MKIHAISKVEIIEVVRVLITAGTGKNESDPLRPAYQYWSKDGELLAQADPHAFVEGSGK
ncbi:MAG TPA: hypothetical protein VLC51_10050 [Nitrospira sp.]|nr:hypothetical protein [Nitrospira sp.]